jgi:hypothetical protein
MSGAAWIDRESLTGLTPERIFALTGGERDGALRFAGTEEEQAAVLEHLRALLPDHTVFRNYPPSGVLLMTILPVVPRARVLERRDDVLRAIDEYCRTSARLVEMLEADTLPDEWSASEHGEHCKFWNRETGQEVEAPIPGMIDLEYVDPYFFALFVKSTPGLERVAELIEHEFHDGARILDIVLE